MRVENLEPCPAFELTRLVFARDGIVVGLAGSPQQVRFDHQMPLGRRFLATQLDENAADRTFAGGWWKVSARPSFRIVALEDRQPEHVRHAPLVGGGA